jgi:hypothetical protein
MRHLSDVGAYVNKDTIESDRVRHLCDKQENIMGRNQHLGGEGGGRKDIQETADKREREGEER